MVIWKYQAHNKCLLYITDFTSQATQFNFRVMTVMQSAYFNAVVKILVPCVTSLVLVVNN